MSVKQLNAIAYYRVSSKDQGEKHSLDSQKRNLPIACERNGWALVAEYTDIYSSKKGFDRPGWNALLAYCIKNKSSVDVVVVVDIDRYGRTSIEMIMQELRLYELGIIVHTPDGNYDPNNPNDKFRRRLDYLLAELDNDVRAKKINAGVAEAARQGYCWRRTAGFDNVRTADNKPTLRVNRQAQYVIEAFCMVAEGSTQQDARLYLKSHGITITKSKIQWFLSNVTYIGKVKHKDKVYPAKHPVLVPEHIFYKVQQIIYKRKGKQPKYVKRNFAPFPHKGMMVCPSGELMTHSCSRSRHGYEVLYYHCQTRCACEKKERISTVKMDEQIIELLQKYQPKERMVKNYLKLMAIEVDAVNKSNTDKKRSAELSKHSEQEKLDMLDEKLLLGKISDEDYNRMVSKVKAQVKEAETVETVILDKERLLNPNNLLISRLSEVYKTGSFEVKKMIVGSIFISKLVIRNKSVSNPAINSTMLEMARVSEAKIIQLSEIPSKWTQGERWSNLNRLLDLTDNLASQLKVA